MPAWLLLGRAAGVHGSCWQKQCSSLWDAGLLPVSHRRCFFPFPHCLLFFWDWHSSCPQNLFPDKAHGALVQEMHQFLNFFFALLIVLPWWCLLLASETQYLSLRERYHGQSCLIPVGSQLDTMPWNPANLNGLCGSKQS